MAELRAVAGASAKKVETIGANCGNAQREERLEDLGALLMPCNDSELFPSHGS